MVKSLRFGIFPVPFLDETCYSLICRYAVRRGRLTTSQICLELFGHTEPLSGYMFKPFRLADFQRWFENREKPLALEVGTEHSCYPFYTAFLSRPDAAKARGCRAGSVLTSGQAKKINRDCGFPQG